MNKQLRQTDMHGNTIGMIWSKGFMWLLILVGFGGCIYISQQKTRSGPLIEIKIEIRETAENE